MNKYRFLFISNLYPPYDCGGYEKHCYEVATGLQARGHEVFVLTSRYGIDQSLCQDNVMRTLYLQCDLAHYNPLHFFTRRWVQERHNTEALLTTIEQFKPDTIMFWGMWMLSKRLPAIAETSGVPVAYMIEDIWPITEDVHVWYWNMPARRRFVRLLKSLANYLALGILKWEGYPPKLEFNHVVCGSRFLKEKISAVIPAFQHAEVVLCGIDLALFYDNQSDCRLDTSNDFRITYVGGLNPDKGVHTVIEAIAHLLKINRAVNPLLIIVGGGNCEYEISLRRMVDHLGISEHVQWIGRVPKDAVPSVLSKQDILVIPSIVEEGFGRVAVEGMAAGLLVIGTATGGSGEILADGVNGLVFEPGDALALAQHLDRISRDPDLYARLVDEAVKTSTRFSIDAMTDGLGHYLIQIASSSQDKKGR